MSELRTPFDRIQHRLALALRWDDHFLGQPVTEVLDVALDPPAAAIPAPGSGDRHEDGTYRFADLAPGLYAIRCASRTGRWTSFEPPLTVTVPSGLVVRELWPTPRATTPAGVLAIRAALVDTTGLGRIAGRRVQLAPTGEPPGTRFTRSDRDGELLFLLARPLAPNDQGRVQLGVAIDGATVEQVEIVTGSGTALFPSETFECAPGKDVRARIAFH